MIFRNKLLDRLFAPIMSRIRHVEDLPQRRLVPCWRPDLSGRLVTVWKVTEQPRGEPHG
jgi:hypothetical protein